jgi:hypothetical protein
MAQDATTVTPPNPSPPTNMSCTGSSVPNPATFDPTVYVSDPAHLVHPNDAHYPRPELAPYFDDGITRTLINGGHNENIPPSGVSASPQAIAVKTAALAVGGTSVDGEGRGTEQVVTATSATPLPAPVGQLKWVSSVGPNATQATRDAGPNQGHASSMTPATFPALASMTPTPSAVSGAGTQLLTLTGTNFTPACRIWADNIERTTTFGSATTLTATVPKKATAGGTPWVIKVGLGGSFTAPLSLAWT